MFPRRGWNISENEEYASNEGEEDVEYDDDSSGGDSQWSMFDDEVIF